MPFASFPGVKSLAAALLLAPLATLHAHPFGFSAGWLQLPDGQPMLGDSHGEIDVDSAGLVYLSVAGGDHPGIQIYSPEGAYLRNLPNALPNHHGFTIVRENGAEVIYAACLGGPVALRKLGLDGEILLEIPASAIPMDERKTGGDGKKVLALTHADALPGGDIYLIDGYASDKIFRFDSGGTYLGAFAGKGGPWNFDNAHKFAIDPRFDPARLLVCDRNNRRLVHLSLDGGMLGVFADNLLRPASVDFSGDKVAVAEINGRVSILGKDGETIETMGANDNPAQVDTNKIEPGDWREGVVTSPHGITFDGGGNVLMTEWNVWGRVLRWEHSGK